MSSSTDSINLPNVIFNQESKSPEIVSNLPVKSENQNLPISLHKNATLFGPNKHNEHNATKGGRKRTRRAKRSRRTRRHRKH